MVCCISIGIALKVASEIEKIRKRDYKNDG